MNLIYVIAVYSLENLASDILLANKVQVLVNQTTN